MSSAAAAPAQARLRVFAGPNGSGKSTIYEVLRPEWLGVYVNADEIEKALKQAGTLNLASFELSAPPAELLARIRAWLQDSELLRKHGLAGVAQQLRLDPPLLLRVPVQEVNSYVSAVLADAIRRELLAQRSSFTFETVMSSRDKIDFMREAQAKGYRTYLYFVATDDPAINVERVRLRVSQGGHDVPEDKIRTRYERSIALLDEACSAADRAYVFDNSGEQHELLVELESGEEMTVHAASLPAWFSNSSLWKSFINNTPADGAQDPRPR